MKKKWLVRVPIYADALHEVFADSEEEAIRKGEEKHIPSLCHHCANVIELGDCDSSGDVTAEAM